MLGLVPLAVITLLVVVVVAYRASRSKGAQDPVSPEAAPAVRQTGMERWVDAGLITAAQADAITAFEHARVPPPPPRRVSPAMEALAYVGAALFAVGAGMLVGRSWEDLGTGGQLAILGVVAAVLGVVGLVVGESDPVTWRLRAFLWALSTGAASAFAGLFAFEVFDVSGEPVALTAAGTGAVVGGTYWMLRDRPLQHALTLGGLAVSIGVAIAWAGGNGGSIGLAIWLLGAVWVALAWRRLVPPQIVAYPLGAILTLVACGIVGDEVEWLAPLLGLVTATAYVGLGVAIGEALLLAPGVVGIFVFLPFTLGYFFGEALGAPAIAMMSGAMLLAVVMVLLRRGGRGDGGLRMRWGSRELGHAPHV